MVQRSGINRPFSWMKKVLEITEETEAPSVLSEQVRPVMDLFGWERLSPQGIPDTVTQQGAITTDIVVAPAVPAGIMRLVLLASAFHDDPVAGGLVLSIQVRTTPLGGGTVDIAVGPSRLTEATPVQLGITQKLLLQPGQSLLCRSLTTPTVGDRLTIRYRFVDLEFGEYLPAY